ncbi:MAG: hypothetical protein J5945_05870 [Candidatus Methanomethylophilus sp.]|jgi:hypothetical protein|nr:hypothetical protein [Methanomethylophilus sp.]
MSRNKYKDYDYEEERMNLSKEEKKYLNSKARMIKAIVWDIIEYIVIFVAIIIIMGYIESGTIADFNEIGKNMGIWLKPGGVLFNALVGFLPIILLNSIGRYFGIGTYGRMVFGIIKCFAVILWLYLVVTGASNSLNLMDTVGEISAGETVTIEGLNVGLEGLRKYLTMIMLCCILIPIGEFCGARKKHRRALAKRESIEEEKAREEAS